MESFLIVIAMIVVFVSWFLWNLSMQKKQRAEEDYLLAARMVHQLVELSGNAIPLVSDDMSEHPVAFKGSLELGRYTFWIRYEKYVRLLFFEDTHQSNGLCISFTPVEPGVERYLPTVSLYKVGNRNGSPDRVIEGIFVNGRVQINMSRHVRNYLMRTSIA